MEQGKAEHVRHVDARILERAREVDPSEDQWKGDRRGEQASPEDELVHGPAQCRPATDKDLGEELGNGIGEKTAKTSENTSPAHDLESPLPVEARRRFLEPDPVVIGHAPGGEDAGEGVDDE